MAVFIPSTPEAPTVPAPTVPAAAILAMLPQVYRPGILSLWLQEVGGEMFAYVSSLSLTRVIRGNIFTCHSRSTAERFERRDEWCSCGVSICCVQGAAGEIDVRVGILRAPVCMNGT